MVIRGGTMLNLSEGSKKVILEALKNYAGNAACLDIELTEQLIYLFENEV